MHDKEREDWINNDEGLYLWKRDSKLSMRNFIRENKKEIDEAIERALHPNRRELKW